MELKIELKIATAKFWRSQFARCEWKKVDTLVFLTTKMGGKR